MSVLAPTDVRRRFALSALLIAGAPLALAAVGGPASFEHEGGAASVHVDAGEWIAGDWEAGDWEAAARLESSDPVAAARAALSALATGTAALTDERQALAFRLGTALAETNDLALAAELQMALHARVRADWSAINAAITLVALGRADEAESLLAAHEPGAGAPGDIANHRGLAAMGRGDVGAARRHFARALVSGSRDAGLSLARLDLVAGHVDRARAGFRPSVDDPEPHAWALRGWSLTLLR